MSPSTTNHSGGPRTAAGIENCKYNATRHGLTGSQIVIKGENPAHYDALRAALIAEHQPTTEEESMLVERIAQNWWKLQCSERYERELLDYAQATDENPFATQRFQNFMRYRNSIERAWNRARTELAALKSAAQSAEKASAKASAAQQSASKPSAAKPIPVAQSVLYMAATASPGAPSTPTTDTANRP